MKVKVLVFPCGSEIGLEINRSLRDAKEVDLWGASSCEDHGKLAFAQVAPDLPFWHEPDFAERLNGLLRQEGFDYFIPAYDPVIKLCAEGLVTACQVLTQPPETVRLCASKRATNRLFEGKIPLPRRYDSLDGSEPYPLFLKPDGGSGSKGVCLARNLEEAKFFMGRDASLVAFDYLPGREYTVDCFTDREGRLIYCGGRTRERTMDGIAVRSSTVEREEFRKIAETVNATLQFRGTWFFQLKEDTQGVPCLTEIGPRLAGSMGTHRLQGINFMLAELYQAQGAQVSFLPLPCKVTYDRALEGRGVAHLSFSSVYIDLDDCLVCGGRLNLRMVRFLYQCLGEGKWLVLLTRHATDPHETLARFRLQNLFDEVMWLRDRAEEKASRITRRDALFIDDSFGERQAVSRALGIPVLSPDMVELLLRD